MKSVSAIIEPDAPINFHENTLTFFAAIEVMEIRSDREKIKSAAE